ncbi:hypothetical protein [Patulibacter defluvii]|uniref:hypothetical protein n=1 Tax=Patulibacter defluvii TaxID=3095358 RepID=UPI002A766066|nr:hypothetical protein [Patulibacter sp. DM4]
MASTPNVSLRIITVPMLDTGIGHEAGYANDAELIAAAEAERQQWTLTERALADAVAAEIDRLWLTGEQRSTPPTAPQCTRSEP